MSDKKVPNAFEGRGQPSTLKIKGRTLKQMRTDAQRVNPEQYLCAPVPAERAQKIRKASI